MDNFNVFKFLEIESKETIHSQFIVSVLKEDEAFYNLFMEQIGDSLKIPFDKKRIITEKVLTGQVGRADIWIGEKSGKKRIIIENKVNARDQERQVDRYLEYLNTKDRQGTLYYLTLNKKNPSEYSYKRDEKIECISYFQDIIPWLEKVMLSEKCSALLSITIEQYIETIWNLDISQKWFEDDKPVSELDKKDKNYDLYRWRLYKHFLKKRQEFFPDENKSFDKEKMDIQNRTDAEEKADSLKIK